MSTLWLVLTTTALLALSQEGQAFPASPQRQTRASGLPPLALVWRCGLANQATSLALLPVSNSHSPDIGGTAKAHPGCNEPATKVHPTAL